MARPKGSKNVKKHVFKDPQIEEIIEQEIEFKDPITGKMIKQVVKVKRLKKVKTEHKVFVGARDLIDDIESKEDDISMAELDPEE